MRKESRVNEAGNYTKTKKIAEKTTKYRSKKRLLKSARKRKL